MSNSFRTNRRDFLRLGTMGLAGSAALLSTSPLVAEVAASGQDSSARNRKPTKIIFMVSDGMSQSVPSLTENLSIRVRNGRSTHFAALLADPKVAHGWFETYSLDSLVTDSAAAGSAWGSGSRIFNGALNTLPDGTELRPIHHIAKEHGWGTGVVTTTTVTHATPASFVVSHPGRGDQRGIAEKYLDAVDIAMGGGLPFFTKEGRDDDRDLVDEFKKAGYAVVTTRDEMKKLSADQKKVLGLFANGHLPYTLDHNNDEELEHNVPTLAEMSQAAIDSLEKNSPSGWVLQIEGGRVDHAAHANDAAAILWDQLAFDDAIGVALRFAAENPDTLVVITSDHGNANPGLNSYGAANTNRMFERLLDAKASNGPIRSALRPHADSPQDIHEVVRDMLGLDFSEEDCTLAARMLNGDFDMVVNNHHRNFHGAFNALLTNHNGIGWTGTSHTEDYVFLLAVGPMQDRLDKLAKNTEGFRVMVDAMGSDFRNPSMTLEEARQQAARMPQPYREGDMLHA